MMRELDLPEIKEEEQAGGEPRPFNMPKEAKHSPAATGCAVVAVAWLVCMGVLVLVALTGGMARLAFWAVGA